MIFRSGWSVAWTRTWVEFVWSRKSLLQTVKTVHTRNFFLWGTEADIASFSRRTDVHNQRKRIVGVIVHQCLLFSCPFRRRNVRQDTVLHALPCNKWSYCIVNRALKTRIVQDAGWYRVCYGHRRYRNNYHRRDWERADVVRDNSLRSVTWCDRDVPCESRRRRSSSVDIRNASDSCFSIPPSVDIWRNFVHDKRSNKLSLLYHFRADAHCSFGWSMAGDRLSPEVPSLVDSRESKDCVGLYLAADFICRLSSCTWMVKVCLFF